MCLDALHISSELQAEGLGRSGGHACRFMQMHAEAACLHSDGPQTYLPTLDVVPPLHARTYLPTLRP